MLIGSCEIQDDVDLRIGEGIVHRLVKLRDVVVFLSVLSSFADEIADADELDLLEGLGDVLQIDAADRAAADHGNFFDSHFFIPFS